MSFKGELLTPDECPAPWLKIKKSSRLAKLMLASTKCF